MRNRRLRKNTEAHAACCRRQDCQCVLGITKDTKDTKQAAQGRAVRAQRRTSGPGACKGMAGFARHALGKGR